LEKDLKELNHYIIQNSNYALSDLKTMNIFEILETSNLVSKDLERKYKAQQRAQ